MGVINWCIFWEKYILIIIGCLILFRPARAIWFRKSWVFFRYCRCWRITLFVTKYMMLIFTQPFNTTISFASPIFFRDYVPVVHNSKVICTSFRFDFRVGWKNQNKHSTLNSSFDALSKWHKFGMNEWHQFMSHFQKRGNPLTINEV